MDGSYSFDSRISRHQENITHNLNKYLEVSEKSLSELSEISTLSFSRLEMIAEGSARDITLSEIVELARILDITAIQLLS